MAVGAAYLARRKAIVQKLTAIESLAGVDVLCSDKTGTLTANKLSLNEPYLADGVSAEWFMTVAVLASSHNIKSLDPIDKVTIVALKASRRAVVVSYLDLIISPPGLSKSARRAQERLAHKQVLSLRSRLQAYHSRSREERQKVHLRQGSSE
jgi:magnesium-transporting ATPase (P-type)